MGIQYLIMAYIYKVESLCGTPESNNIVDGLYFNKRKCFYFKYVFLTEV